MNARINQHTIMTKLVKAGYQLTVINGKQVLRKTF
jgi:hypothetical protein